jgi:hypothetical protein
MAAEPRRLKSVLLEVKPAPLAVYGCVTVTVQVSAVSRALKADGWSTAFCMTERQASSLFIAATPDWATLWLWASATVTVKVFVGGAIWSSFLSVIRES